MNIIIMFFSVVWWSELKPKKDARHFLTDLWWYTHARMDIIFRHELDNDNDDEMSISSDGRVYKKY